MSDEPEIVEQAGPHPLSELYADPKFQLDYFKGLTKQYDAAIVHLLEQVASITEERDRLQSENRTLRNQCVTLDEQIQRLKDKMPFTRGHSLTF